MADMRETILDALARARAETVTITDELTGIKTAVLITHHDGAQIIHPIKDFIDPLLPTPRRKKGKFVFQDLGDLISYANDHSKAYFLAEGKAGSDKPDAGMPHTFVDANTGGVAVVFNHHSSTVKGQAHGDHRATFQPVFSTQWNVWTGQKGALGAADFADFVDDNIEDIGPEPEKGEKGEAALRLAALAKLYGTAYATREELIALSKGIRIHAKDEIEQVINPQTGEVAFAFSNDHTAKDAKGGTLKVPGLFILAIPVFEKGDVFRLPVRLKYRAAGGSVSWSFKIISQEKAKDAAIADIRAKLIADTKIPTFYGTP